jgi:carboxypeptidase family protein
MNVRASVKDPVPDEIFESGGGEILKLLSGQIHANATVACSCVHSRLATIGGSVLAGRGFPQDTSGFAQRECDIRTVKLGRGKGCIPMLTVIRSTVVVFASLLLLVASSPAQQTLGSINGTVKDSSGGVVAKVAVKARNPSTNLTQTTTSKDDGSYSIVDLPIGTYEVSFSKDGFKTEVHSQIIVQGGTTTTVNGSLQPGEITTSITVSGTPLLNQTDTTNGYTLGAELIESTPLGTGSFTQLALLSPGVNADFLTGSGSNAGLGNQNIFANGQRDTSNSFIVNGVQANNIFNGKSSSGVADNRAVLNTGQVSLGNSLGGEVQTLTSVYSGIGQALPSPPPETIEEIRVNTSMYDASEGAYSGAHVTLQTRSGTNELHGQAYEYHQTSAWNAAPFFFNQDPTLRLLGKTVPELKRNTFGVTLGGPIRKDKLFFFASYQGQRASDEDSSISEVNTLPGLTDTKRDAASLQQLISPNCGTGANPACPAIDPVALNIMNLKLPSGKFNEQFFIPSETIADVAQQAKLGYNALVIGPKTTFKADQVNGNIDYNWSTKDRLAGKYYYQNDPTYAPFAISQLGNFPQQLTAGSHAFSLENTTMISPNAVWTQRFGFIREKAFAHTTNGYTNKDYGMNIFGLSGVPGISITNSNPNTGKGVGMGPASNFSNAGIFQNEFEGSTKYSWTLGRHTLAFGFQWDHTQLNVANRNNQTAELNFSDFTAFLTGTLCTPGDFFCGETGPSTFINGATNRYYRSNQVGTYATDTFRFKQNLTLTLGLRWDWDGPLTEKNGLLANFYPQDYSYVQCTIAGTPGAPTSTTPCDPGTDVITGTGIVVAGNNKQFPTKGVSNSTLTGRQWGFAPRIGLAWTPGFMKNFVIRTGFGMYYDRGEYLAELSPSAGGNFNGPFGVTVEAPFVVPLLSQPGATFASPFGTAVPQAPKSLAGVASLLPNITNLINETTPLCLSVSPTFFCTPIQFAGYDPRNKLPYSENWMLDLQWQPRNDLVLTLSYVGNHGVHLPIPVPFNQPNTATPSNPIHGQTSTYGYNVTPAENIFSLVEGFPSGNVDLRVPFIGFDPNSQYSKAAGISNYHALQFHATKRVSHGLTLSGSYTWSHAMDEESGEQLFYNGNNPLKLRTGYANSDFDRRHVFIVSYQYELPKANKLHGWASQIINGWGTSGLVAAESGQPYSVIDFSGGVASIFFGGGNDFVTNPLVPIGGVGSTPGAKPVLQGTLGINPANPVLNPAAFGIPLLTPDPATNGIPIGDNVETGFAPASRNIFVGPFQSRVDMALFKNFKLTERFRLRFDAQAFNIFNHPSFDTPNNNVEFNPFFANPPTYFSPFPVAGQTNCAAGNAYVCPPSGELGRIQHTIGSPRFLQMALHLTF